MYRSVGVFGTLLFSSFAFARPMGVGVVEPWALEGDGPLYHLHHGQPDHPRAQADRILVIGTTTGANLIANLGAYFTTVDYFDATIATPSLATLQGYDAVLTYSGWGTYLDPTTLGNNVADFVDGGGGAVLTGLNHYVGSAYQLGGRMQDAPYTPLNRTGSGNGTPALGDHDANHPIMQGVTTISGNWDLLNVTPHVDATWVATWTNGNPGVYVSSNGKVVGVQMYVNDAANIGGDTVLMLANALNFAAGGATPSLDLVLSGVPASVVRGTTLSFFGTIHNTTTVDQSFDAAELRYTGPAPSGTISLYAGPPVVVPAGSSLGPLPANIRVPGSAPLGTYTADVAIISAGSDVDVETFSIDVTD